MGISNVSNSSRPGICTSTTRPTAPYEGQTIYQTDDDKLMIYDGSAWKPIPIVTSSGAGTVMTAKADGQQGQMPYALAAGTITATSPNAYQNTYYGTSASITFATNRFSQTPMVVANVANGGYGWASAYNPSSTGISYMWLVADSSAASRTINWIAIQMTSNAGNA